MKIRLGTNETATSELQQEVPADVTRVSDTIEEESETPEESCATTSSDQQSLFKQPPNKESIDVCTSQTLLLFCNQTLNS